MTSDRTNSQLIDLKTNFFIFLFNSQFYISCEYYSVFKMEQDEHDLEEGEIEDDDEVINVYTPLQRPETYALDAPQKRFTEVGVYSDSEDDLQSSDTDSDSDTGLQQNSKKPKRRKITPKPLQRRPERNKKYDIWSTRTQEDVLAETMVSCDVTIKDRSRSVESYDYTIARKHYEELENRQGMKRTRDNMKDLHFTVKTRSGSKEKEFKGKRREIPDLSVDASSNVDDIVKEIANKLGEERDDLILKVVQEMGKEKSIEIYKETKQIEYDGGMPILNQTRRRTPGGVYLYLVRNDYHITPEQKRNIFNEEKQKYNRMIKDKRKKNLQKIKAQCSAERIKILPDLLTRAEQLAKQNPTRKLKEDTDEANCTNPPPSPETDHHESGDGMEPSPTMESRSLPVESVTINNELDNIRGKLKTYDEDFLEISCDHDMDMF